MFLFYIIIILALVVGAIIGGVKLASRLFWGRAGHTANRHLLVALSLSDGISQLLYVASWAFLGLFLFSVNKSLGSPIDLQYIVAFMALLGLYVGGRLKLLYLSTLSIVSLICWYAMQGALWAETSSVHAYGVLFGILLVFFINYLVASLLENKPRWRRFATMFTILGLIPLLFITFVFSTSGGVSLLYDMWRGATVFASVPLTIVSLILLFVVTAFIVYGVVKKQLPVSEGVAIAVLVALFSIIGVTQSGANSEGYGYYYSYSQSPETFFWAMLFTVVSFLFMVGLILSGFMRKESWRINLGAIALFVFIVIKYFDWFFVFLDKSIFFIGAGILLFIVGALMEKGRKYMIKQVSAPEIGGSHVV